jgi:hypothetical protein
VSVNLSFLPTGSTWGHACQPTEVSGKVALVKKSHGQCDFGQRQFGIAEHVLGLFDASPQ